MDKKEYQEKLQEINRLIAAEDYEGAARIADTIDWKRVRNVQTLIMISEVYEVLERYEDSKVLLLRAYRRSPVGRTVLYRLVECCIKLRQFDQAIEYYSEYVQAAPHDNNKYILKYKIYQGRGSSLDEQIDILKEYLDQEYNEKWAYELAKIEIQAGRTQEGLATCDDLVLWFHSGKYVIKALELKKKYAPLTPKQQEIYDNRFEEEEEGPEFRPDSYLSEAASLAKAERAAAAQEEIKTELAADISHTAQMEATKAELTRKAEEAQAEVDRKAEEARKALVEGAAVPQPEETAAEEAVVEETAVNEAVVEEAVAEEPVMEEAVVEAPVVEEPAVEDLVAEEAAAEEPAAEESVAEEIAAEVPVTAQAVAEAFATEEPEASEPEEAAAVETTVEEAAAEETAAEVPAAEEAEAEAPEAETEADMPEEEPAAPVSPEQMQEDMIRSMREIVSGVGPKDQIGEEEAILEEAIDQSKEDQENAVAARGTDMTFRVPVSEASQKRQAGRLTIDDILLSMGDQGDYVRQVTGGTVMSAEEEAQMTAQQQAEAKAASYDGMNAVPAEDEDKDPEIPHFLREEVREARQTSEIPAGQIAEADDALRAQMGLPGREEAAGLGNEAVQETQAVSDLYDNLQEDMPAAEETVSDVESPAAQADAQDPDAALAAAALMSAPRVTYTKEIAEAKTRRLPVEEIRKIHEAYLSGNSVPAEETPADSAQAAAKTEGQAAGSGTIGEDDDIRIAGPVGAAAAERTQDETGIPAEDALAMGGSADEQTETGAASDGKPPVQEEPAGMAGFAAAGAAVEAQSAGVAGPQGRIGEQVTIEVPKSEPEPQIYTGRPQLKESQMDLFRGFTSIGTLPEQIAGAIWQAENRKDDRTSRSGNILILGAHGCGKTTIATGIAKAIAEDSGTHSVKMARIYAADLNRKDIAATIAKIAGGVLIVEEAGDLDDAIVDQLTTAMEFRTDGLIMILEDEQRYIHDLLMRHPRFTMKFTAQIYIPEYSVDDLVNFGQIYANSKDYVFSEKAVEACRVRVEAAKKDGEAVSVTNVIELVDRAIKNASTFFRRIGSSKKRYDSEDRVILQEKDFR